jgi:hypothetical protein
LARVHAVEGVLEDHLDARAELAELALRQKADVAAKITDGAGGGLDQAQDAAPDGGLAGAALAHQPH